MTQKDSQQTDDNAADPREAEAAPSTGRPLDTTAEQPSPGDDERDAATEPEQIGPEPEEAAPATDPSIDAAPADDGGVEEAVSSSMAEVTEPDAPAESPDDTAQTQDVLEAEAAESRLEEETAAAQGNVEAVVIEDVVEETPIEPSSYEDETGVGSSEVLPVVSSPDALVPDELEDALVDNSAAEPDSPATIEESPSHPEPIADEPAHEPDVDSEASANAPPDAQVEPYPTEASEVAFGTDEVAPELDSESNPQIIVRTGWERPPPLVTHPSWVVRDVSPDIVPPAREPSPQDDGDHEATRDEPEPTVEREPESGDEVASDAMPDVEALITDAPPEVDFSAWRNEIAASRVEDATWHASEEERQTAEGAEVSAEEQTAEDLAPAAEQSWPEPANEPLHAATDLSPLAVTPSQPDIPQAPVAEPQLPWAATPNAPLLRASASDAIGYDDTSLSRWEHAKALGRTAARYAAYAVGGYFALVFVLILLYRVINPPFSSLMAVQALTGTDVQQDWVSLEKISPSLVRAVIVSEDWSFCEHYGIDIKAIEDAIERSGNGIPRGASTISMQTTKNLFLWNAKSYVRKAVELPLTLMIELIWPKSRILEVYLNVAEWGPGIFGAEAAARYHFNKPASRLGEREAAQLAASLPNPIIREAGDPGPRTARKATVIQSRMRNAGGAADCVLGGRR